MLMTQEHDMGSLEWDLMGRDTVDLLIDREDIAGVRSIPSSEWIGLAPGLIGIDRGFA